MDMDQAAVFLAGSILTALGFLVVIGAAVIVNNVLHKYWKPVRMFTPDSFSAFNPPQRFSSQEDVEKIAPSFDKEVEKSKK
jgi:hypothetical protein